MSLSSFSFLSQCVLFVFCVSLCPPSYIFVPFRQFLSLFVPFSPFSSFFISLCPLSLLSSPFVYFRHSGLFGPSLSLFVPFCPLFSIVVRSNPYLSLPAPACPFSSLLSLRLKLNQRVEGAIVLVTCEIISKVSPLPSLLPPPSPLGTEISLSPNRFRGWNTSIPRLLQVFSPSRGMPWLFADETWTSSAVAVGLQTTRAYHERPW